MFFGTRRVREIRPRMQWPKQLSLVFAMMGYCVGLANLLMFSYKAAQGGGGAFLFAYLIMFFVLGIPLLTLEICAAQMYAKGPAQLMDKLANPLFKGIGISSIVVSFIWSVYYNVIIAWLLRYWWAAMTVNQETYSDVLPWLTCNNTWNHEGCMDDYMTINLHDKQPLCSLLNQTSDDEHNEKYDPPFMNSSSIEFAKHIMGWVEEMGVGSFGTIIGMNVLCLASAWIFVFLAIGKGVSHTVKVVYYTASLPYAFLLPMIIIAVDIPGHSSGLSTYLVPKWEDLKQKAVWFNAAGQVLFSVSIGAGGALTMASYNRRNHNPFKSAVIIMIASALTSFIAGIIIFAFAGHIGLELCSSVCFAYFTVNSSITLIIGLLVEGKYLSQN